MYTIAYQAADENCSIIDLEINVSLINICSLLNPKV